MKQVSRRLKTTSLMLLSTLLLSPMTIGAESNYTVQSGDTLAEIASSHGVTIEDIISWNQLSSVYVPVGTDLTFESIDYTTNPYGTVNDGHSDVYEAGYASWASTYQNNDYTYTSSSTYQGEGYYHTIQPGDTLWDIAMATGTTVDAIQAANGIGDWVSVGSSIFIPGGYYYAESSSDKAYYESPEPGESTSSQSSDVVSDEAEKVASTGTVAPSPDTDLSHLPENLRPQTYQVQSGDNIWRIANQHDVTSESLRLWNDLKEDDVLTVGQVLFTSSPAFVPRVHKLEVGDVLEEIANKYELNVDDILLWNEITDIDNLAVGDYILISNPTPLTHQAVPEETLDTIASNFGVTAAELKEWNFLPESTVVVNGLLIVSNPSQATP